MPTQIGILSQSVAIGAGQSLSGEIDLGAAKLTAIFVPSGWTAANLTLQASPDGGVTWGNLYTDAGAEVTFVAAAGQMIAIDPTRLRGINCLKLRSGTSGTPVNQVSAANLTLIASL